jgi:uncharacterized membrane protein YecN with MAPEG domain
VDDQILMGVGEDGSFFILDVKDRERQVAIGSGGRREREALPWAEEVLITKSDLEEKKAKMAELEAQVRARACARELLCLLVSWILSLAAFDKGVWFEARVGAVLVFCELLHLKRLV